MRDPRQMMELCSRHEDEVTEGPGQNLQELLGTQPERVMEPPSFF